MYKIWFWKPLCDLNNPSFVLKLNCRNIRGFWLCAREDSKELDWGSEALQRTLHRSGHCEERRWQRQDTELDITIWSAWIGLYRDPQIYWSDGSNYSFSSWYQGYHQLGSMKVVCGVADLEGGNWRLISCEERKPFVCYSIPSENLFCISELLIFYLWGFSKDQTVL